MTLALLLLLAAGPAPRTELLFEGTVPIGGGKLRSLDIPFQDAVRVVASWEVLGPRPRKLRVTLMDRNRPGAPLATAGPSGSGALTAHLTRRGDYVLWFHNQSGADGANVRLHVRLIHGDVPGGVSYPDPVRSQILAWGSVLTFGAIALFAALKLRRVL